MRPRGQLERLRARRHCVPEGLESQTNGTPIGRSRNPAGAFPHNLAPTTSTYRCRVSMAHIRQSRRDSGLGFQCNVPPTLQVAPSSLDSLVGAPWRAVRRATSRSTGMSASVASPRARRSELASVGHLRGSPLPNEVNARQCSGTLSGQK